MLALSTRLPCWLTWTAVNIGHIVCDRHPHAQHIAHTFTFVPKHSRSLAPSSAMLWVLQHSVCALQHRCAMYCAHGRRQQRIRELREAARRPRFGSVEEIRGHEFVQQVRVCTLFCFLCNRLQSFVLIPSLSACCPLSLLSAGHWALCIYAVPSLFLCKRAQCRASCAYGMCNACLMSFRTQNAPSSCALF